MINLKQKFLVFWIMIVMSASAAVILLPAPAYAEHAKCYEGNNSIRSIEECTKSERDKNNVACFENNTGNNEAVEACVNQSSEHHNATGSKTAAENAPALPSDALAQSTGNLKADCNEDGPDANSTALDKEDCGIVAYIVLFTNVLSGVVGIVIVIMIAVGGLQYSMARDDPQAVNVAKTRIKNAIFALVIYLFGFAFLQYLVPGGIF